MIGRGNRRIDIAAIADPPVQTDIARRFVPKLGRAIGDGMGEIGDRLQILIIDIDQLGRF